MRDSAERATHLGGSAIKRIHRALAGGRNSAGVSEDLQQLFHLWGFENMFAHGGGYCGGIAMTWRTAGISSNAI
jgi:hypothetical protein